MYIYTSLRRTDSKKIKLKIKADSFPFIWLLHFLERTKPPLLISENSEHNKSNIVRIPAPGPAITHIISCSEKTSMDNEIEEKKDSHLVSVVTGLIPVRTKYQSLLYSKIPCFHHRFI